MGARGGGDGLCDGPSIEFLNAAPADGAQSRGQILLHQPLSDFERNAVIEKYGGYSGFATEFRGGGAEHVHIASSQHESILCEPNGGRHERRARQG
jgi:hypothetical protein